MPITPIEVAAMVPKSQDASLHRQQQTQKPINEQIQIHQHINTEIKHNNQQTVKTQKSDNKEYRYDAKEKGNNSYSGSKGKKGKKDSDGKDSNPQPPLPGSIDIRI
ncbi:MAG: hypothetical protein K0S61_389 [Anaerocolumna sp.]|nr:hypothetical protein [Anaerocolumna sp.]